MALVLDGQLQYSSGGAPADNLIGHINSDGSSVGQQSATSVSAATIGFDLAAGYYFVTNNDHLTISSYRMSDNALISTVQIGRDLNTPQGTDDDVVNALAVDPTTHTLYVGDWGQDTAHTGIVTVTYNASTGVLATNSAVLNPNGPGTDAYNPTTSYLLTNASTGGVFNDARDFYIDTTNHLLYYTDNDNNSNFFGVTNGIYVVDYTAANPSSTLRELTSNTQFPTNESAGYISSLTVDTQLGLVYFETHTATVGNVSGNPATLWTVSTSGSNNTATQVTLPGGTLIGTGDQPPGGLAIDEATQQLYIAVQSDKANGFNPDDVLQLQLSANGHSATVLNTYQIATLDGHTPDTNAHIQDLAFDQLPTLGTLGATTTHAPEQGASVTLLTSAPTITDTDQTNLASATVTITGGTFSSNENSTADDHLTELASALSGTNITASYNSATETLTLTGNDTLAHYSQALAGVQYNTTGDNPTNYGNNNTRTLTFQVNDGAFGNPSGTTNVQTMSLTIDAVNDAPNIQVLGGNSASMSLTESNSGFNTSRSLTITDPDSLTETLSLTNFSDSGPLGGLSTTTLQGFFSVPSPVSITQNTGSASFNWTFNSGAQAFDYLAVGETLTLNYTIHDVDSNDSNAPSSTSLSDDQAIQVTIAGTNDAPTITNGTTQALTAGTEDTAPAGQTVSSLLGSHFSDVDDNSSLAAVAIVSNGSSASGNWQWSTDGSSWSNVGTASDASAVFVHAASFLRFLPAANFNGTAPSLSVRLVDDTQTSFSDGATANVGTNGGTTPYSTGTVSLTESVSAVNDAPVVNGATVSLTAINEDTAQPSGQSVSALFASHFDDSADNQTASGGSSSNTFIGVAVRGNSATASQGVWQYSTDSGLNWSDISTTVSDTSAVELDTSALLRFVPAANFNGSAPTLSVRLIEDSNATTVTSGNTVDVSSNGGSTSFSDGTIATSETINAVNDAPTVVNGTTEALTAIDEDNTNPPGTLISSVYGNHFDDSADNQTANGGSSANTLAGIAITANAATPSQGTWQWSTDGTTWNNIATTVSDTSALVLASTTQIRFLPAANYNGTAPDLTSHLIDSSAGAASNNTTVNLVTTGTGGTTQYSTGTVALSETINAVNDPPVVTPSGGTPTYTELQAGVAVDANISVSDIDSANLVGATVAIANAVSGDELTINGLTSGSIDDGANGTITYSFSGSTLTLTGTDTVADYQSALRLVTFDSTSHDPTNGSNTSRTIDWQADDGGSPLHLSAVANSSVTVTAVNDAPTVGTSPGTIQYIAGQPPILIDGGVVVNDADNPTLASGTVSITGNFHSGEDVLSFTPGASDVGNISALYNAGTGVLSLTSTGASATLAQWQNALEHVFYQDTSATPNTQTRTISFQVNDGTANSPAVNATTFVGPQGPYDVASGGFIASGDLDKDGDQDLILANHFSHSVDVLLNNGDGTFAAAQNINVPFSDLVEGVLGDVNGDGNLDFVVNDDSSASDYILYGQGNGSFDAPVPIATPAPSSRVRLADVNHDNRLDIVDVRNGAVDVLLNDGSGGFTAPPSGTSINGGYHDAISGFAVADLNHDNNPDLVVSDDNGLSVLLGNGDGTFQPEQTYSPSIPAAITVADLNGDNNPDIAFGNGNAISVLLGNGDGTFQTAITTPASPGSGTFIPTITVADVNLDGIPDLEAALASAHDIVVFTGDGTGHFAVSNDLATSNDAYGLVAQDLNGDTTPDLAADNITNGGGLGHVSVFLNTTRGTTRQITLDQPPVVDLNGAAAGSGSTLNYTENDAATLIAPAGTASDTDSPDFNGGSLTVHFSANGAAEDQLSILTDSTILLNGATVQYDADGAGGNPAVDIGTVSGGTNGADLVVSFTSTDATPTAVSALIEHIAYADNSDNPSTAARSVLFTVDDGDGASGSDTATINIAAVNDAPVVGGTTGVNTSYTEQAGAVVVDSSVTVSDVDSTNLAGATVSITSGFTSGDTLHFSNQNGISFVSYTGGVLTLSGSSSVANYQTALRSITFDNATNDDPTATSATRTITWRVDDGSASNNLSNAPTSAITITPVNDAPVVGGTTGVNTAYTEQAAAVTVDGGVTVSDADSANLVGATVSITGGLQSGDTLHFTNQNGISFVSYTGGVLTLSGSSSVANYQTALQSITFDNTANDDPTNGGANTTRTITWQVDDGSANNHASNAPTSTITITAVNDGPVNTVPVGQSVNEDTSLVFSSANSNAISTSDADNASGSEQVQLSVSHGTLTLSQTSGLAFTIGDGTADATMTFTGTVANVNAALNGLTYLGNANYNGPDTLTIHTDDQGNTGTPGALTDQDTVAITVNAVNDSPVLTGVGDAGDTPVFTENGSPVVLDTDNNAAVSDVELDAAGNYAGATLTLSRQGGANPDDVFGSVGSLDLTDVGSDGNVSLDGGATFIATYTQPGDGSISFTFNANATAADVDSVMRQITYLNTSDNPPATAPIDFTFDDGNGESGGQAQGSGGAGITTGTITVQITQIDDAPVLSNVAISAAYSPGSAGAMLSTANVITDPDATPPSPITGMHSATVQIANFFAGDELFVNLPSSGGHFLTADGDPTNISATYAAGTLTLSGVDSISHYQQILDAVSYRSTVADPSNGGLDPSRTITWQVNDGALNSQTPSPGVDDTIPPVNETVLHFDVAPAVDLDGSTPGTGYITTYTTGNAPIAIVNNDSVTDPDTANADSMTIVLTNAMAGDALSVAGSLPGGITSSVDTSIPGQITLRLTNSASMADYQTALAQVRFVNSNVSPNTTDRDITVVLSESGGVTSNTAHATVHVVDATPPAKPPAPDLTDATDSGVSHTDNITNVAAPTFTGNVEPGTTVRLYDSDGTTVIGTGAADAQTGAYSITSSSLSQGTHHLTVTATDASNNTSVHSDALDVTIDTTPPTPTLTAADPTTTFRNSIVHYTLSYPETTFGVDASDFTLTMSGGATGAAITGVSEPGGPATPYTISVSTGTGFGSIEVDLRSSGTGITDTAGNASGGATGPVYSIVNRPPVAHNDVATLSGAQTTILGNLLSNDSDADGDTLRVTTISDYLNGALQQVAVPASGTVTLQSTHGAFTVGADGSYSFTANDARPVQNHYAIDPLIYALSDGNGGTAGANLEVHLSGQQRPSTETFNFNFVQATVSYGSDGEAYLTGPDAVVHNVTGVNLLIFNDGRINEGDYNQTIVTGPPPGKTGPAGSSLVDDLYYDSQYHDVYLAGVDPEAHYAANGWHEGRNPNPYFNTNYYLSNNPDVAAAHINPLDHYDTNGWREGRNPGPNFNTVDYELANPDVAAAHVDPLAQYLSAGELENRVIFPANAGTDGPVNGFDPTYYLANNPDVAAAHVNPLQHYLQYGWHEGRNPSADFNTNYYESHNPDVAAAGIDPLLHYDQSGWHEGRDPSGVFSTNGYLTTYTDVAAAGVNPLQHYLQFGMAEGRSPTG